MGHQKVRRNVSAAGEIGPEGPLFLVEDVIARLHREQIELFGGAGGIRDAHGFSSACAAPENSHQYEPSCDLFDLAAAYAFHIGKNHPFVDGNKRTAAAAALVFLRLNEVRVIAPSMELYAQVMALMTDECTKDEFAEYLRRNSAATLARLMASALRRFLSAFQS